LKSAIPLGMTEGGKRISIRFLKLTGEEADVPSVGLHGEGTPIAGVQTSGKGGGILFLVQVMRLIFRALKVFPGRLLAGSRLISIA